MTRKKTPDNTDNKNTEIDYNIKQGIFVLLLSAFEIFIFRIITININSKYYYLIIAILSVCYLSIILNGLLLQKHKKLLYYLLPVIQIILILSVEYLDVSSGMQFIVLTVVAGIINEYSLFYAKIYSATAFILYFAVNIAKEYVHYGTLNNDEVIS
jgi:hypothetical protein